MQEQPYQNSQSEVAPQSIFGGAGSQIALPPGFQSFGQPNTSAVNKSQVSARPTFELSNAKEEPTVRLQPSVP